MPATAATATATAPTFIAYDGAVLPLDLDGDPFRVTEHLGAWKMTSCCGAAVSAGDLGLYCKACYGEAYTDGPARLLLDEEPTACPACGSDDLGVFAASEEREDEADLVECERCKWTAALTPEGAAAFAA